MSKRTELHEMTPRELEERISRAVQSATRDLSEKVARLQEELDARRRAVTHLEAVRYFAGRVSADTIKDDYIHGRRLPEGQDVPLPARKVGTTYFIETDTLQRWQMGECTEEDLFPWQKRKLEKRTSE